MFKRILSLIPALALIAVSACAEESTEKPKEKIENTEVGSTPNVAVFDEKVYFGGQPQPGDIEKFAELGVKTVINLRTQPEMDALGFDEKAAVEEAGMKYIHVPMGREEPTQEFIDETLKTLGAAADDKILVHCGSSNRVGYVWSLFAAKDRGLDTEEALEEGKAAGMRSPKLQEWCEKHIEHMKKHQ